MIYVKKTLKGHVMNRFLILQTMSFFEENASSEAAVERVTKFYNFTLFIIYRKISLIMFYITFFLLSFDTAVTVEHMEGKFEIYSRFTRSH